MFIMVGTVVNDMTANTTPSGYNVDVRPNSDISDEQQQQQKRTNRKKRRSLLIYYKPILITGARSRQTAWLRLADIYAYMVDKFMVLCKWLWYGMAAKQDV